jgi:endonuclease/exonuclease/phosphatase family metal-dependent hydrolase
MPKAEDLPTFHDQYGFLDEIKQSGSFSDTYFSPAWAFKMAGTTIDVGLAILSKHYLTDKQEFHVTNAYYVAERVDDYQRNTRVFQSATAHIGDALLSLANYQGYLAGTNASGDEVSETLMKKVANAVSQLQMPLVFCGDFNVAPNTKTMLVLDELGLVNLVAKSGAETTLSPVHRAPLPDRNSVVCDYILASPEISVRNFEISEEIVSDHKALILEFDI